MDSDQVRVIFERVAYQMVLAGWLKSYRFTAEIGHELEWRTEGAQKALLLKDLSERFHLAKDDRAAHYFHMACKGVSLPEGIVLPPIDIEVSTFWLMCVSELKLSGDDDGLLGMVQLITRRGPEVETSRLAEVG